MQAALNLYTLQSTEDGQFPLYAPAGQAAKAPAEASPAEGQTDTAGNAPGNAPESASKTDRTDEKKEGGNRAETAL